MRKINKISLMVLSIMLIFTTASFAQITIGEDATVDKIIINTEGPVKINGAKEGMVIESNVDKANVIIQNNDGESIEREIIKDGKLKVEEDLKESQPEYVVKFVITPDSSKFSTLKLFKNGVLVVDFDEIPETLELKFGKYKFELGKDDLLSEEGEINFNTMVSPIPI